jgi:dynein heavy chain
VDHLFDEIVKLYNICGIYKANIQPTDLAMFQTLAPVLRTLKEAVDVNTDTRDDNIAKFSVELDKMVTRLMQEVSNIRNRAQEPMIFNPNSDSTLVLNFINDLSTQLDKCVSMKETYEKWADLFKNRGIESTEKAATESKSSTELTILDEAESEINLKQTLWTSLRDWASLTT